MAEQTTIYIKRDSNGKFEVICSDPPGGRLDPPTPEEKAIATLVITIPNIGVGRDFVATPVSANGNK